ncbi:MAG TPA: NUDIX domain-containing protein [Chloroflexota bacterium]|nr:NUDIX domain-containing protein [Chloroflexota bacterium]
MIDLGVAVAVFEGAMVLLAKREDSDVWCLPGGAVEDGETVAEAAVREAKEESGLDVRLERLIGTYSRPSWSSHQVVFLARLIGGMPRLQEGETTGVEFFELRALPPIVPWHHKPLEDAVHGVGGSAAWKLDWIWPFPPGLTRREIYEIRYRSGLSRKVFFDQQFCRLGPNGEKREV